MNGKIRAGDLFMTRTCPISLLKKTRNPSHRSQSVVFGSSRAWGQQKGRGALDVVIEVSWAMKNGGYIGIGDYSTQLWLSCWCQLITFLFVGFLFVLCLVSDEQMSNGWLLSLRNDKQMSNKVGVLSTNLLFCGGGGKGGFKRCKFFGSRLLNQKQITNHHPTSLKCG